MNKREEEFLSSLKALCVRYDVSIKFIFPGNDDEFPVFISKDIDYIEAIYLDMKEVKNFLEK